MPERDFSRAKRAAQVPALARIQAEQTGKERITIRLDADVLAWFRAQVAGGGNYQSLMKQNAISKPLPDNFPKTATDWERVIAAAPGEDRALTAAELALMERSVVVYGGGPLAVREALAKRRRGPGQKPPKQQVTLRIEPATLARWKASGSGWQTRIAQVLAEHAP